MTSAANPADRPGRLVAVPAELEAAISDALTGTATERAFRARVDVDLLVAGAGTDGEAEPLGLLFAARAPRPSYDAVLGRRRDALATIHTWLWDTALLAAQAAGLAADDDGLVVFARGECPDHGGALQEVAVVRGDVVVRFAADSVEGTVADEVFELLREALVAARATDTGADVVVVWPAQHTIATFRRRCADLTDDAWVPGEPEQLLLDLNALGVPDVDTTGWDHYDAALTVVEDAALASLQAALTATGLTGELTLGRWQVPDDASCTDR